MMHISCMFNKFFVCIKFFAVLITLIFFFMKKIHESSIKKMLFNSFIK